MMTEKQYRKFCIHYFDGDCTRKCKTPAEFRPCEGYRCPRMKKYLTKMKDHENA